MTNLPFTGKFRVTCEYLRKGNLWYSGYHKGIDMVGETSGDVYCTCDGVVKTVSYDKGGWGYYVRVQEKNTKNIHIFCHMSKGSTRVKEGQRVSRDTIIGKMGSTGNSTGAHLHFQIEKYNKDRTVLNPTNWLGIPNKVGNYDSKDYQLKEVEPMTAKDFKDSKQVPDWAYDAVDYAARKGLMQGDENGKFRPNDPITRAEIAVVLQRLK
jgi:hypothetical protein